MNSQTLREDLSNMKNIITYWKQVLEISDEQLVIETQLQDLSDLLYNLQCCIAEEDGPAELSRLKFIWADILIVSGIINSCILENAERAVKEWDDWRCSDVEQSINKIKESMNVV